MKNDLQEYTKEIYNQNEEMAKNALRVLACAYKVLDRRPEKEEVEDLEKDLTFIRNVRNDRSSKA